MKLHIGVDTGGLPQALENCERLLHTSLQMAKFAFISLLLNRC